MSEQQNFETLDSPEITEKKPGRAFLISLSVVTFITSAARILLALAIFYFFSRRSHISIDYSSRDRWTLMFSYALLFSSVFNSMGAIFMLLRKRFGFWVYLAGFLVFLFSVAAFVFATNYRAYNDLYFQGTILTAVVVPITGLILYGIAFRKTVK